MKLNPEGVIEVKSVVNHTILHRSYREKKVPAMILIF